MYLVLEGRQYEGKRNRFCDSGGLKYNGRVPCVTQTLGTEVQPKRWTAVASLHVSFFYVFT